MKRKIVSFSGFEGSGKDTAAQMMNSLDNFSSVSFATPLKRAVAEMFGWSESQLLGLTPASRQWRETADPYWSEVFGRPITPRTVLQEFGTDVVRQHFLDRFWIAAAQQTIQRCGGHVLVTDARFPNELDMIKSVGGVCVRIRRGDEPWWYNSSLKLNRLHPIVKRFWLALGPKVSKVHPSEREWIGYPFDFVVDNNGSLEDLRVKIKSIYQQLT